MEYDATTALIVVDMQNDFASPDGALAVAGAERIIDFVNRQAALAAARGSTVVYTQDWHPPSTPHFAKDGGIWPVHCVGDTRGAALHADVDVPSRSWFLRKGTRGEDGYSAFTLVDPTSGDRTSTDLGVDLTNVGVQRVVVVGLALDYCVKATALDALEQGFKTTVLADGTRAVDLEVGDGARSIVELTGAGVAVV